MLQSHVSFQKVDTALKIGTVPTVPGCNTDSVLLFTVNKRKSKKEKMFQLSRPGCQGSDKVHNIQNVSVHDIHSTPLCHLSADARGQYGAPLHFTCFSPVNFGNHGEMKPG